MWNNSNGYDVIKLTHIKRLNKSSTEPNKARIDLENFQRGDKEDKNKGKVLYYATVTEKPYFEQFQRAPNTVGDLSIYLSIN